MENARVRHLLPALLIVSAAMIAVFSGGCSPGGGGGGGDAGFDAGVDASIHDSGLEDASFDSGETDTGVPDAGVDAGVDAGTDGGVDITKVIDQSGGTVEAPDGLKLVFPAGALEQATTIHIQTSEATVVGVTKASSVYLFEPTGLVFKVPVTVSVPFNSVKTDTLALYWSKIGDDKSFDRITGAISGSLYTAQVTHFSKGFDGYPSKVRAFGSITSGGERLKTTNYQMDLYVAPAEPIGQANSPGHKINLGPAALKTVGK